MSSPEETGTAVVISGPFIKNLLHNHSVNDEANFSFFILLHKRAKPILPPYLLPHLRARTQTLILTLAHPSAHPSAHTHPMMSRFEQKI